MILGKNYHKIIQAKKVFAFENQSSHTFFKLQKRVFEIHVYFHTFFQSFDAVAFNEF